MASPKLIIFDCDGVLIDSERLVHQSLVEELANIGIPLSLEEALNRYVGRSSGFEKADIKSRYGIVLTPDFFEKRRARLKLLMENDLKPIPGVLEFVKAITCKKCVASGSSFRWLRHTLGVMELWDHFAPYVFSAEQVKAGKPAPDLFLFAAEQVGVLPSDCLVIEDSIAGVRAAKAADMRVFGFTGGSHCGNGHAEVLQREGAERVFTDMREIAEVLL